MRLDRSEPWTAANLLNRESESELRRILRDYGQERWGSRISQRIVERRRRAPFKTTKDLVDVVDGAILRAAWPRDIDVVTRTFQAFRIAVNRVLEAIVQVLYAGLELFFLN